MSIFPQSEWCPGGASDGFLAALCGSAESLKPIQEALEVRRNSLSRTVGPPQSQTGTPKVGGLQWELGAVGNAEWTGVPLAAVLKRAGVKARTVEVVLEGADNGAITKEPVSP